MLYFQQMLGTAVFAITGVLAIQKAGVDVFGAVVLGIITAIGGGTVRDLLLDQPIFWIADFNYIWVALIAAALAFFSPKDSSSAIAFCCTSMDLRPRCSDWSLPRKCSDCISRRLLP
ncbi:trimeric intracellular cation channel family protein [Pseudomonas sp. S2_B07]